MSLTDNLVAYYKLDGNSNDSVGSNNGTDTSITYGSSYGKINQGASFNGSSSYINTGSGYGISGSGSFTMSAWIKGSVISSNHCIAGFGTGTTGRGITFDVRSSKIYADFYATTSVSGTTTLSTGTWYFATLTYDGTNMRLYLNGSLEATSSAITANVLIGSQIIGRAFWTSGNFFNGYLDEIGIWSRALSADEVSQLYNSGRGNAYPLTDTPSLYGGVAYYKLDGNSNDSVGSNNGTDTSISYSSSYGKINQGASFNGSSSRIAIAHNSVFNITSAITLLAWIKTTSTGGNQILCKYDDSFYFAVNGSTFNSGKIQMYLNNVSSGWLTGGTVNDGNWHFVVGTYDGSTIKLYIDGSLSTSVSASGSIQTGSNPVEIGTRTAISYYFNGDIDEIGIWSRALSSTEVSELYNSGAGLQYPFTTDKPSFFPFFNHYL